MKKIATAAICLLHAVALPSMGQAYRNLVFEGAGVRGIAYVGALKVLEEKNVLPHIEKVGGTSAGAIAALTVALGYSSADIEQIIYSTRIQKFNDGRFMFVGGISRMNRNYGWKRTVSISSGNIGPKIMRLSSDEKNALITNGYSAMTNFLMH